MKKDTDRFPIAFISMSGRDSAMWFSYTGLHSAIDSSKFRSCFYFPSSQPELETNYTENVFYYSLSRPFKTVMSLFRLARKINRDHCEVFIFSQGVFSAFLVFLLKKPIKVFCWGHEVSNRIERAGFFRGLNYYISDFLMSLKASKIVVASESLVEPCSKSYALDKICVAPLPVSGDFSSLNINSSPRNLDANKIKVLFFGTVTGYKGLKQLGEALDQMSDTDIDIVILGRGDLKLHAPSLYDRSLSNRNVRWVNEFITAETVLDELATSDFMYVMYDTVTATSQVDIANLAGVPVLASELPYFQIKVENGVNGLILQHSDLYDFFSSYKKNGMLFSSPEILSYFHSKGVNTNCVNALVDAGILN
jgi:glycosyltransferase involved in cell wall biosynthesis